MSSIVPTWDGIVSCLRSYTPDALRAMTDSLEGPRFSWQQGRVRPGVHALNWLSGLPEPTRP